MPPLPSNRAPVPHRKYYIDPDFEVPRKFRTICEVLRELYRDAKKRNDAPSMQRLDECHDMAKRMQRKLMQYNKREIYPSIFDVQGITGNRYADHPLYGTNSNLEESND